MKVDQYIFIICCYTIISIITPQTKKMHLFFNLNLAILCEIQKLNRLAALFSLRKSFVVHLQTELGKIISRKGIAKFKSIKK